MGTKKREQLQETFHKRNQPDKEAGKIRRAKG